MKQCALAIAIAAILVFPGFSFAQVNVSERLAPDQPPVIVAQRALGGGYPENSLAGIRYALDNGIDMVKIDVQLTRDGQYVVMHDWTLNRTTNVKAVFPDGAPQGPTRSESGGKDYIRNYTLAEVKRLRLQDGKDGGDHSVPTLEEALDLVDGRIMVAVGLKMYETESLAALLRQRDTQHLLFFDIYYADPRLMHEIIAATGIKGFVAMPAPKNHLSDLEKLAAGLGPNLAMVTVKAKRLTPELIARAGELGVRICITGLGGEDSALLYKDDPSPWQDALASGAAAFLTAHPDTLLDLTGRSQGN